jgi:hypothetical protein
MTICLFTEGSRARATVRDVRSRLVLALLGVVVLSAAGVASAARKPIRVTFVGDSVAASINYVPAAQAKLRHGFRLQLDLKVCRRLVQTSCSYQGSRPSTALDAVVSYGASLGDVLIVKVGYNESAQGYRQGIDRMMRAALKQGATGVVWVTLRETQSTYHWTNVAIKTAAKRWPQLVVADWDHYSHGKSWFGGDGLHLTATGATALAGFVRPYVFRAAQRDRSRVAVG